MNIFFEFLLLGVFAGSLIYGFMVLNARYPNNTNYKIAVGLALAATFLLFWVNGAVGIIGSSNNDANMMFFGVLAIPFTGALIARFVPKGMARTMFTTAGVQILVATIALAGGFGTSGPTWPWDVVILTVFFSALWVGSGILFQKAAQ